MIEPDPKIVASRLSRTVTQDGVTIKVPIIRLEHEAKWSLKVVNPPTRPSSGTTSSRPTTKSTPSSSGLSPRKGSERSSTAGKGSTFPR